MLQSIMTLLPAVVGNPGGPRRHRRGGRSGQPAHPDHVGKPIREDAGNWIWIHGHQEPTNFYLYARKTFKLPSSPTKATLKTSAVTKYKLFVNGRYVGKGPVPSGEGYVYYDSHDITSLLTKGDNVVAFLVYHIGGQPVSTAAPPPGLICKIEIQAATRSSPSRPTRPGKCAAQPTGPTRALGSPRVSTFRKSTTPRGAQDNWNAVKFNEKGWENAAIVGVAPSMPWGDLVRREIPPLAEERILPRAIAGLFNSRTEPKTPLRRRCRKSWRHPSLSH